MMSLPRWSWRELITRYELEPSLKDAYVEGLFDQTVITRCLSKRGVRDWIIYPIDVVEISDDTLAAHNLTTGNKNRVIALARELARAVNSQCKCIVDRDLDHWFGELESNPHLVWTKYASLELYFFSTELLKDILLVAAKARISDWTAFEASAARVLTLLYSYRLADRSLRWSLKWLTADRCLSLSGSEVKFDDNEYRKRLLLANTRGGQRTEFDSAVARWQEILVCDPRHAVRGHDLTYFLAWAIEKFRGLESFADEDAVEQIFILLADDVPEICELVA